MGISNSYLSSTSYLTSQLAEFDIADHFLLRRVLYKLDIEANALFFFFLAAPSMSFAGSYFLMHSLSVGTIWGIARITEVS